MNQSRNEIKVLYNCWLVDLLYTFIVQVNERRNSIDVTNITSHCHFFTLTRKNQTDRSCTNIEIYNMYTSRLYCEVFSNFLNQRQSNSNNDNRFLLHAINRLYATASCVKYTSCRHLKSLAATKIYIFYNLWDLYGVTYFVISRETYKMVFPTRISHKTNRISHYHHNIFVICLLLFTLFVVLISIYIFKFGNTQKRSEHIPITLNDVNTLPTQALSANSATADATNSSCTYFTCFNVYRCGSQGNKLLIYVYPPKMYLDATGRQITSQMTKEFYQILNAIINSKFYTPNPYEACIFVPSIDTLNQNRLRLQEVSQALRSLPL